MGSYGNSQNSAVTYPSLVLKQIGIIQGIVSKELRDSTKIIKTPIGDQIIESEDTRYSFLQSVELFGSMLSTYFDTPTEVEFTAFTKFYDAELVDAIKNKEFQLKIKEVFDIEPNQIKTQITIDKSLRVNLLSFFLTEKCKMARSLFRTLIKCFKSNDFLAQGTYTDNGTDDGLTANVEEEELTSEEIEQ